MNATLLPKIAIRFLAVLLATALLARADVLPPSKDTSSMKGILTAATGKAATLAIVGRASGYRQAYVQFNLSVIPGDVQPTEIANARLRIYFTKVTTADDIVCASVASEWDEVTPLTPPVPNAIIGRILAANVVSKKFVEINVTDTVRQWRAGTLPTHGFVLYGADITTGASNLANVLIGAKEGPGSGYPCELEVQIDRGATVADGSIGGTQLADGAVTTAKLAAGAAVANLVDGSVALSKLASSTFSVTAGTGLAGGGSVALGGNVTLSLGTNLTLGGTTTGTFSGDGSALTNLPAPANVWQLGGNAGTTAATHFLGTTDNQPIEFIVNGQRALRMEYVEGFNPSDPPNPIVSVNMIGGVSGNVVSGGVLGATIGGGGSSLSGINQVTGDHGTVSGGTGNSAGEEATVSGGAGNLASGYRSMIPGGRGNLAASAYSFAAGIRAQANHEGAFVWADFFDGSTPFASSAPNQFNVRASGGVRIFSNGAATLGVALAPNATAWSTLSDQNAKKNFAPVDVDGVLERLAAVPVQRWNYKSEPDDAVPHLGPMAQAFKAAFYPGRDDKVITTLEFDGVELAAIQGLHQKLKEKDAEIAALKAQLAATDARLTRLETLLPPAPVPVNAVSSQ